MAPMQIFTSHEPTNDCLTTNSLSTNCIPSLVIDEDDRLHEGLKLPDGENRKERMGGGEWWIGCKGRQTKRGGNTGGG